MKLFKAQKNYNKELKKFILEEEILNNIKKCENIKNQVNVKEDKMRAFKVFQLFN